MDPTSICITVIALAWLLITGLMIGHHKVTSDRVTVLSQRLDRLSAIYNDNLQEFNRHREHVVKHHTTLETMRHDVAELKHRLEEADNALEQLAQVQLRDMSREYYRQAIAEGLNKA